MRIIAMSLAASVLLSCAPALAAGNAARGAAIFQRCALCHSAEKDGGNGVGPNLFAVNGRKAASLANFPYSPALKNSKIVWTDDKLKAWVSGPARLVPGTRMSFPGLSNSGQADDVLAYLHTKK
jgi:cytochrome c